ncbi:ThiJ/PfpI family protein [Cordyceps fumosorosea ARSEF 2679]|uniref:ThiJ/PfpI family protein n=1 Tax=Cordyceps fumosorosea (strain ARSEF 2679) TaxID=1081104 RepID=A0A162N134_CORFA|nr:ThiJ/PfpI family protein [Cordyceps fumosorosea ARSEF 2679]OAA73809.1 ThiJ/PfpI family protein [Cordyceps fumosorosea ARSEF 2679]
MASVVSTTPPSSPPLKYAVALFNGFQLLDAAGPLDVLAMLSPLVPGIEVVILAQTLAPVTSRTKRPGSVGQEIVPTHTFDTAPDDIEVLLIPGGGGTRDHDGTQALVDYAAKTFPKLRYFLTVCTGAALAVRAGLLDGRRATTNKLAFDWVASLGPKVNWVRHARWVSDGNIWTSSGISAGIDMTLAFVAAQYGEKTADTVAYRQEYIRNKDPNNDPFAPDSMKQDQ